MRFGDCQETVAGSRQERETIGMNEAAEERAVREIGSPEGKVLGAVEPDKCAMIAVALAAAGFPADQIDIVTAADLDTIESPFTRDGLRGYVERFLLSLGEELNPLEELRHMARDGHTLVGVPVEGDEAVHRAAKILRDNGAHEVTHFGRWSTRSL
jgi:hypothetical protein